ncbi:MAG: hypothetical protein HWD85_12280 [Flavobacteriaceae bacterium]|nr:hypothetical protein [Flavobacteriaceae bacterium]
MKKINIYIDSACDVLYSSFYIKGLEECFGFSNLFFRNKPFRRFKFNNHYFAFIIEEELSRINVVIDYSDSSEVSKVALDWCDIYYKINIDEEKDYNSNKILSIGPSFGIKIFSFYQTFFLAFSNYFKSFGRIKISDTRRFFSNYKAQYKRPTIYDYFPGTVQENYLYFVGSLWKKEPKTNMYRANFIKACLSLNIKFEGGFAPRIKNDIRGFEGLTMNSRDKIESYIKKTKLSIATFNTPAVLDCHGWKLAEFLCFGKAIISTKLTRKLPLDLLDNEHLLYTDGSQEDIKEKLEFLIENKKVREKLEKNARGYFENELSPQKVVQKILFRIDQLINI